MYFDTASHSAAQPKYFALTVCVCPYLCIFLNDNRGRDICMFAWAHSHITERQTSNFLGRKDRSSARNLSKHDRVGVSGVCAAFSQSSRGITRKLWFGTRVVAATRELEDLRVMRRLENRSGGCHVHFLYNVAYNLV